MGLDFFPFVLILAIWECQHSPFLGIPLVGDRPPSFLFFRAGTFLRSGVFAYLTGHPRREPGDECKSRRKKTEFSFCLSAAGKIKRSWDFEIKEAPGGSPGSFTSNENHRLGRWIFIWLSFPRVGGPQDSGICRFIKNKPCLLEVIQHLGGGFCGRFLR